MTEKIFANHMEREEFNFVCKEKVMKVLSERHARYTKVFVPIADKNSIDAKSQN